MGPEIRIYIIYHISCLIYASCTTNHTSCITYHILYVLKVRKHKRLILYFLTMSLIVYLGCWIIFQSPQPWLVPPEYRQTVCEQSQFNSSQDLPVHCFWLSWFASGAQQPFNVHLQLSITSIHFSFL